MTVTLTNVSDGAKAFVLSHDLYCVARGECACAITLRGGRRIPSTLMFAEGEARRGMPRAVLSVPIVAAAVRRGRLRLEEA